MLHLFRNNSPYTVILLFLFALLIKLPALLHPVAPVALPHHATYGLVLRMCDSVLQGNAFGYTFLALAILFGEAIYLNTIVVRHRLFNKATYLPAFLYLALSSVSTQFSFFSPFLLVNACVLGALDISLHFAHTLQPRKQMFNAGFLLSLASLLHFPAVAYFPFFIFAMLMLRPFNIGEWVVAMLGYLTPYYFFAGILFLADRFPLLQRWPELSLTLPARSSFPAAMVAAITGAGLLLAAGLLALHGQMSKATIYVRRSWSVVVALLITSLIAAVLSQHYRQSCWLLLVPGFALVASATLHLEKRKRLSNFAFLLILAFTIYCQFALHT